MGVLMRVVDRVVVLDHGEKIFDGAPKAAQSDRRVVEVYLGADAGLRRWMLELDGIDAGYGGFQALFGVSMRVNAGEAVAVIGANGAGKTTLLRVISGPAARRPRGTMTMEGATSSTTPPHKIIETGIAHVPESRRLFPRLSRARTTCAWAPSSRPRARKFAERLDYVYALFPRLKERRAPARRHHVGRRAADVRHRPRADERARSWCCSTSRRWGSPR